ncbi:hypothetical protein [Pontibacter indicus]|uniref:Uncharacterized protein n=1 Tax=Pontibacter indicus TaxID=1317125 RepID=A0A1R3XLB2_9BACT|nr:hypothetical protein [Pontibacter indicus]SIT92359.1 hypothetical protein SAMN05444128_2818 [Pontibacter indicus]
MTELHSEAENIENVAQTIMGAFKAKNIQAGEVLSYQELYPYLQERYPKYKDVQKEAEHHLAKLAWVTPAPEGLMLTQVGESSLAETNE